MATKRKRNDLTLRQKYDIVKMLDQKFSQKEISIKYECSQPVVSKISKTREEIRTQFESSVNPDRKRQRTGKDEDVENALSQWFTNARSRDIPLSGAVLTEKAKDLAKHLNKDEFQPSSGWLSRWKGRNSIVYKKMHGEMKDADIPAADSWREEILPNLLEEYSPDNIYNADETGIYYRALPDGSLTFKADSARGSKKVKERITAMVACNMSGTDKRRLFVIGKSKKPRCFRGKTLPVIYDANIRIRG